MHSSSSGRVHQTPGLEADKDLVSRAEWGQQDIQEASDWPLNSHLTEVAVLVRELLVRKAEITRLH